MRLRLQIMHLRLCICALDYALSFYGLTIYFILFVIFIKEKTQLNKVQKSTIYNCLYELYKMHFNVKEKSLINFSA